ncbi:MAG: tetratricopeptide repeat protein [Deltaproteobacteria bacterium]|nr:tetratricopeptide repeat protein [Deltaproteobacteria bacterium]
MMTNKMILAAVMFAAACGGGQKAGSGLGGGKDVPPPPPVLKTGGDSGNAQPKIEHSADAKKDYAAAMTNFTNNDKGAWSESACRGSADQFASVARQHTSLVEAQFMVGLSYHRCNLLKEAEAAYQTASRMKGDATKIAMALSNLGEIYYRAGKIDGAKQYWESAIKANGKLIAARINIASLELEQMRKIGDKNPEWKKLEEDARFHLSNVLGVESDSYQAYTVYGLIYMEGWQKNKNRLDLAKLLLDEGKKRNEKYAPLQNAFGLYYMRRNALSLALQNFQAAVELDPKFIEARMNVGLITLNFRNYPVAKEQFTKALELDSKRYDAYIGLGAALRGLKDLDGAEAQYKKAQQLDPRRGEAYYNLGVLYKDFRASKQDDLKASLGTYATAKDYFRQFQDKQAADTDKAEAKEQVTLIDKTTAQISTFLKAQANQPPPPPAQPTPGAAPAPK